VASLARSLALLLILGLVAFIAMRMRRRRSAPEDDIAMVSARSESNYGKIGVVNEPNYDVGDINQTKLIEFSISCIQR
jgi:membrane protein implicated in regulation of membrane protease activity